MAVNKVVFGADTLMDISGSTVTPETLLKDIIAYAANGEKIVGTAEAGGLPDRVSALATGLFALSSSSTSVTSKKITHGLGVEPNFFLACVTSQTLSGSSDGFLCVGVKRSTDEYEGIMLHSYFSSSGSVVSGGVRSINMQMTDETFTISTASSQYLRKTSWVWICGVLDGIR